MKKLLYEQQNSFFETKLCPHLFGFRSRYRKQHALSNLLFNWQNCLDKSGVAGSVLMDLFKAFDCLPHDLIIAKLNVYGVDHDILRLITFQINTK